LQILKRKAFFIPGAEDDEINSLYIYLKYIKKEKK
jgi:hypothetical protein